MHKMMKEYKTTIRDSFRLKRAWFITEAVNLQKRKCKLTQIQNGEVHLIV